MVHPKTGDTSWDEVAKWYDQHVSEASDYHRELIIPGAIRMLAPQAGEKILDLGCGQGAFCRRLASLGVSVTGVDSSKKLINIAQKKTSGDPDLQYKVADATRLTGIRDGELDAVCSILALQNMESLEDVVKESARVLKKGEECSG